MLTIDLTALDREHLVAAIWFLSGIVHNRFLKAPPLDFTMVY